MDSVYGQACYRIHSLDNVCTALSTLLPGDIRVVGSSNGRDDCIGIREEIAQGHKLSAQDIAEGEPIIKYGVVIGIATRAIVKGEWVHLHNCKSRYDERSSTLDPQSGAPTDTSYE